MNRTEYDILNNINALPTQNFSIHVSKFSDDPEDRTLLWGYTVYRDSFHVYVKDEMVHLVVYGSNQKLTADMARTQFDSLDDLVPNKRLYPEACDFEFCVFLKRAGVSLPFTTWRDDRPKAQFYGDVAPPF